MENLVETLKTVITSNGWAWDNNKNTWKKNRTTKSHDELYIELIASNAQFDDYNKKQIVSALDEATKEVKDANQVDLKELNDSLTKWENCYKKLVDSRWSDFDNECWKDMYYTLDDKGEKMVVARVSPESREIRILGKTEDEISNALIGIFTDIDKKVHRHAYIDNLLTKSIIYLCSVQKPGVGTPVEFMNGICLPASVANILYQPLAMIEEKIHYNWKIVFNRSSSYYPTVKTYIRNSLSAFLAQDDKLISEIVSMTNDKDVYAYTYINLDKYKEGPTDIWDTWGKHSFNSKSQYDCFCAWIGSIFIAPNTSKQSCWLQGVGNMALSKIQNAIYKEIGKYAVASFTGPNALEGQFVNANVVGKRLAVISDSKNENHIRKGVVHNWTGGDVALINQKNKQAFSMAIYMKVMICENIAPAINFEQDNQMSRVLYFKMKVRTNDEKVKMGIGKYNEDGEFIEIGSGDFQAELDSQVNAWIFKCIQQYYIHCPNNAQIIPYKGHLDQIIARCADRTSELLYDWLIEHVEKSPLDTTIQQDMLDHIKIQNFNTNDGYSIQSLNLMLEKYFQVSASKDEGKKKYVGIKLVKCDDVGPNPDQPDSQFLRRR